MGLREEKSHGLYTSVEEVGIVLSPKAYIGTDLGINGHFQGHGEDLLGNFGFRERRRGGRNGIPIANSCSIKNESLKFLNHKNSKTKVILNNGEP